MTTEPRGKDTAVLLVIDAAITQAIDDDILMPHNILSCLRSAGYTILPPASTGAGGDCEGCSGLGAIPTAGFGEGVCPACGGSGSATPSPPGCPIPRAGVDAVAEAARDILAWSRLINADPKAAMLGASDPEGLAIMLFNGPLWDALAEALAADAQKGRTSPVTQDEMYDCYQGGKVDPSQNGDAK